VNIPISTMSTAEKIAAMEELWTALQQDADSVSPPEWHAKVLAERQARIDKGETSFLTLEEIRSRLENLRK